jgi:hypothetical protein
MPCGEWLRRALCLLAVGAAAAGMAGAPAAPPTGRVGAAPAKLDDPKALPGQIIVDPAHPQWLKRNGGGPVYLCGPGDPEGFLYRGKRRADGTRQGDQLALIGKLVAHGGNCIYMQAVRSHGGDGKPDHNPFVDSDPAKGLSKPILDQWERWFRRMDDGGICIYLFLFDDSVRLWGKGDGVPAPERAFVRAIVRRFRHHKSLVWIVAEESEEAFSSRRVQAIAAIIRDADARHHPIGNHHHSGLAFKAFRDGCALGHFAIQYNKSTARELHDGMVKAWRLARGRYGLCMSEAADHMTDLRRKNWACGMGGAHAMALKMSIHDTPSEALKACRIQQRFFESTDFVTMAPHDELASAGTQWVLADPRRSYLAYAAKLTGHIGLKNTTAGTYDLTWVDCVTGGTVKQAGVSVAGGNATFPKPAAIGSELAVWIRRAAGGGR